MKNKMQNDISSIASFQTGQVWRMGDSKLEVGLVGRTLVHYKHYKGLIKRPSTQLSSKISLEKFLAKEKAVLIAEAAQLAPAGELKAMRFGNKPPRPARKNKVAAKSN